MELFELSSERPRALIVKKLLEFGIPRERIIAPFGSNNVIVRLSVSEWLGVMSFPWIYVEKYNPWKYKLTKNKKTNM